MKSNNLRNEKVLESLREQHKAHIQMMTEERRGYSSRQESAIQNPAKYCSIIVDGADQKSFGLPHFVFNTKSDKGHKIKVKCIGVLEHKKEKNLTLFTITEEFESGANHVIEAIHRVLNRKKNSGKLPPVLFIQADNCTRQNKNRFFFAYFEFLVAKGVFTEVQISFLPIGHTHTDIDQAFSSVATRLRNTNAKTMQDLVHELSQCYQPRALACEILQVANVSGLCENSKCLTKVKNFSVYRYFRFSRDETDVSNNCFNTICHVKVMNAEQWSELLMPGTQRAIGFLKFVPDLRETPSMKFSPLDNVAEVNKCLRSCEERINSREKQESLEELRDKVYSPRVDTFHWNLDITFELNGDYIPASVSSLGEGAERESCGEDENVGQDFFYAPNRFVAVKTTENCRFWIAQILRFIEGANGVHQLEVVWYSATGRCSSPYAARYEKNIVIEDGHSQPHRDTVSTDTVLCEFDSLTASNKLHVATQKSIRQVLDEN